MKPIDKLLPHIQRLRPLGPDVWAGSCPTAAHTHGDRSRGLRIRECDDGRLLLWCGAGCGAADIVAAIGLDLVDLFPERPLSPDQTGRRTRPPRLSAAQLIDLAAYEAGIVAVGCGRILNGEDVLAEDLARVQQAIETLRRVHAEVRHEQA
jgi:hypothetical protein